ncbi:MAG: polysaccharide deacetylase family protein [Myxococcota bacterium]
MLQYLYRGDAPPTRRARTAPDQAWSDYVPIVERPRIAWPGGARVALWVCPNVLFYEYLAPHDPWLGMWTRMPQPDVLAYGRQDYGARVGFWRMLEALDRRSVRCTACVNVEALARFPSIRDAAVERGWCYLGHGMSNSRFIYGLGEAQEKAYYAEMQERLHALTGARMLGMGGPGPQAATESTPDVLAELGFLYHADWFHDDQPFPLRVRAGRLISLPYALEVNDAPYLGAPFEADQFLDTVKRQFDTLWREGEREPRVMCLSLHPALIGQPQRIRYLEEALDYLLSFPGVWQATGDQIAEHYMREHFDAVLAWLDARRVEK